MQKVISCYAEGGFRETYRNLYTRWKFGKPKHMFYVRNRRSAIKTFDLYDKYILDHLKTGHTIAFDSAGYYLDGVVPDLTVVDFAPIVKSWYPKVRVMTDEQSIQDLYQSADNFIVINTIPLRYKTFDFYTNYWSNATRFFRPGCNIFFSFRDIFMYYNKIKYSFQSVLENWLADMQQKGFVVQHHSYDPIPVTEHMTVLEHVPEIDDMVNGNVKIHWEYRCR